MIVKDTSSNLSLPPKVVIILDGRYLQYAFNESAISTGLFDRGVLSLIESRVKVLSEPFLNEFPCANYPLTRMHLVMPVYSNINRGDRLEAIRELHRVERRGVTVWPVQCRLEPSPDGEPEYHDHYLGEWAVDKVQEICDFEKPDVLVIVSELKGLISVVDDMSARDVATISVELDGNVPIVDRDDPSDSVLWARCDAWTMIEDDSLTKCRTLSL